VQLSQYFRWWLWWSKQRYKTQYLWRQLTDACTLEFLIRRLKCCNLNKSVNITASLQLTTLSIFSAHLKKRVRRDLLNNYVNKCKKFMKLQSVQNTMSTSLLSREIHYVLERTLAFEEWEEKREWKEISNEQTYIKVIWQWIMLILNSEYQINFNHIVFTYITSSSCFIISSFITSLNHTVRNL